MYLHKGFAKVKVNVAKDITFLFYAHVVEIECSVTEFCTIQQDLGKKKEDKGYKQCCHYYYHKSTGKNLITCLKKLNGLI